MARSIRIEYAGAYYHVMARGNRRQAIFEDDEDRAFFIEALGEACVMTGWRVHAWVLMENHYHLLIQTPEPNLVSGMQWLQNTYTRRYNVRHRLWGRLFGDRYKAVLVEGDSRYYYETLVDYLHLNPARAKMAKTGKALASYRWSSLHEGYLQAPGRRPAWMAIEEGLDMFGFRDNATGRRKFLERLVQRMNSEDAEESGVPLKDGDERLSNIQRGWYWGAQEFAEKALKISQSILKKDRHRGYRSSHELRAHGEKEAAQLLEEGLSAAGLTKESLRELKGSDPRKVVIGRVIRARTIVKMKWIADHLQMRSAANASQQLKRKSQTKDLPKGLMRWEKLSRIVA